MIHRFLQEQSEKQAVRSAFSTYMTPAVVEQVLENPELLALGGTRRDVTVFFSDIANFTSLSEGMNPETLVGWINEYLEAMSSIILKHGGTLDKFEGDGIMAFWGAPIEQPDHAHRAARAALECSAFVSGTLAPRWRADGRPDLRVRIGVNTGDAVVGNMGSTSRMDYTVMGDAVNLAARLEAANKSYETTIMIGPETQNRIDGEFLCRELDDIRLKGKSIPTTVYELICPRSETRPDLEELKARYEEGLKHYREGEWSKAMNLFESILQDQPDGPAQTAIERCHHYASHPPPPDWDGVWQMHEK